MMLSRIQYRADQREPEQDDPRVPLQLLIYSVVITVTTTTCLLEMYSWDDVSQYHKKKLLGLYGPYLALGELIFFGRSVKIVCLGTAEGKKYEIFSEAYTTGTYCGI